MPDDEETPGPGVEDGTVLTTPIHGAVNTKVVFVQERVVVEEDGTWHKEAVE